MARTHKFEYKINNGGSGFGFRTKNKQFKRYTKHCHRRENANILDSIEIVKYDCKFKTGSKKWHGKEGRSKMKHSANYTNIGYYYNEYKYDRKQTFVGFLEKKIVQARKQGFNPKQYEDALKKIERRGKFKKFSTHRRTKFHQEEDTKNNVDKIVSQDEQDQEKYTLYRDVLLVREWAQILRLSFHENYQYWGVDNSQAYQHSEKTVYNIIEGLRKKQWPIINLQLKQHKVSDQIVRNIVEIRCLRIDDDPDVDWPEDRINQEWFIKTLKKYFMGRQNLLIGNFKSALCMKTFFLETTLIKLQYLNLISNPIGNNGLKWLIKAQLFSLLYLKIDRCLISDEGAKHICKGLWPQIKNIEFNGLMAGSGWSVASHQLPTLEEVVKNIIEFSQYFHFIYCCHVSRLI